MSTRPTTRTVVCHSIMHRMLGLLCVLALGLAVQGVMAAPQDGMKLVGKKYHAKDFNAVADGFAAMPGWSSVPGVIQWMVPEPGIKAGEKFKGGICDTPEELIAHFRSVPAARTARGIFIMSEITFLDDFETSKEELSDYQQQLMATPEWVAGRKKTIEELARLCEKEKIDLWINVNLGGKNLRFRKLTK